MNWKRHGEWYMMVFQRRYTVLGVIAVRTPGWVHQVNISTSNSVKRCSMPRRPCQSVNADYCIRNSPNFVALMTLHTLSRCNFLCTKTWKRSKSESVRCFSTVARFFVHADKSHSATMSAPSIYFFTVPEPELCGIFGTARD